MGKNKIIAIITARGGSKRIPDKNIKNFCGQPMIKFAIDVALESELFDTVMVSTEDEEIANISRRCGAEVPFMRSEKNADDYAVTSDVLIEVINKYKEQNIEFNFLCCIYPCVPLLEAKALVQSYKIFVESGADILVPIVKFSYPIQRAFCINSRGFLEYVQPECILARSQDLKIHYHDVGQFYFYKITSLSKKNCDMVYFEMHENEVQDIDTEEDWKMAEMKYHFLNKK